MRVTTIPGLDAKGKGAKPKAKPPSLYGQTLPISMTNTSQSYVAPKRKGAPDSFTISASPKPAPIHPGGAIPTPMPTVPRKAKLNTRGSK